jgi:hypothetical protein
LSPKLDFIPTIAIGHRRCKGEDSMIDRVERGGQCNAVDVCFGE